MTDFDRNTEQQATAPPERVPFMQQVLDNPFLLLFLGITVPAALYLIWGVMEIASIPVAN